MENILSIIIPTYNMEKYLDKCLASLIIEDKELMRQLEVLIVIDGAKDRSSEIAYTYQNRFSDTFRVIDKENGNYGSCINRGLKEATGKYVKVLDADDYFDTANFEIYLKKLLNQDNDLIITNFEYVNEQYVTTSLKNRNIAANTTLVFSDVMYDFNANLISMHELTYRRDIFIKLSYHQTEGISYTDLEWCFIPMIEVNTVVYFDIVVYKYLIGREGQTVSSVIAMRTLSHKMKSGMVMARQYEANKDIDFSHKAYLNKRIVWSVGAIYYNYLVSYYKHLSLDELIAFDKELQTEAPFVYRLLDDEVLLQTIPIHYISAWRRQNDLHNIPMSVRIGIGIISIYQKIKH